MSRIAALVLAAGRSTRMGVINKLVAPLRGKPLVVHTLDALYATSVSEIVVVTGHDAAAVERAIGERAVSFVHNERYAEGMGGSIAAGVATLADADGVLICLGDMPDIPSLVVEALIAAYDGPERIVVPMHAGRRGHPVLFGSAWLLELRGLRGDCGARDLLAQTEEHQTLVACEDPGIHRDVDTPADLEA